MSEAGDDRRRLGATSAVGETLLYLTMAERSMVPGWKFMHWRNESAGQNSCALLMVS